jgi:predicted ATP-grasp superfamily ATP-dependent carboligase
MKTYINKLHYSHAKINKGLFFANQVSQSYLSSKPKMKILFSNKTTWKPMIEKGFKFTKHEISFEAFLADRIQNYNLVVPLTISDLKFLSAERHLIANNPIPIPSLESIILCDDKYLFNKTLEKKGFGAVIPKMNSHFSYPYILKKKIDAWGKNTHIIYNQEQELYFLNKRMSPEYFTQELIFGHNEYATHIIFKDKRIISSINNQYVFQNGTPVKGKDTPLYTKMCCCPYLDMFSSVLLAINFEGLCCFNYKVIDNKPFILEINPRFGGSLCPYFFSFIKYLT